MKTVSLWIAGALILPMLMVGAAFADEDDTPWYKNATVTIDAVGVVQGTPGMTRKDDAYKIDGFTESTLVFDLRLTVPTSKSGKAYIQLSGAKGEGIDERILNFSLFNAAVISEDFRVKKIWYEHSFGNKVRLRGGKIDLTTDFDTNAVANDEYDQFLSDGFVNNLTLESPDGYGNFGAMLWISPNDLWDIGFGVTEATQFDYDREYVFQNPFTILEIGVKPKIADKQGNYRLYGWRNGKDHVRFSSLLSSDAKLDDANYGFGISADQEVSNDVTLFARYGHQRGSVSEVEHSWSAGVDISGRFLGREEDTLGFAYGQAVLGKDYKLFDDAFDNEHRLELYYKIKSGKYLNFTPNLQWVKNPAGDKGNNNVWAFGIRTYLNLF